MIKRIFMIVAVVLASFLLWGWIFKIIEWAK